jgi:hypothetical protein
MLCIKKGQDRTKVLLSNALYPTCRVSASNAVVTNKMLDEESKCSMFKKSKRSCFSLPTNTAINE